MKKNATLYILLFFLVVVNVFFLFNYLGKGGVNKDEKHGDPLGFLTEQLDFSDSQKEKLKVINKEHRHKMMRIGEESRNLKDAMFSKLAIEKLSSSYIDSITNLIGKKEAERDKEAFYHFKKIEEICVGDQKEKFKKIIKEAIGKGARPKKGSMRNDEKGHRPPPIDTGDRRPPPPNH